MSWKRATGVPCLKDYRKNKKVVEDMVGPKLAEWLQHQPEETENADDRIHDLCDAEKISEAGLVLMTSKQSVKR